MLIDLLTVILVSILYYLLCNRSRFINLIIGMLLIFIFCWAAGISIVFETEISEVEFIVVVAFINVWITIYNHHLSKIHSHSRMKIFHHYHYNNHIYTVRNQLNTFRIKNIKDDFNASPDVYLKMISHQIDQLDDYVDRHSKFHRVSQLINSLKKLPVKINDIDFYLDLPMQINYPHGLERLIHQYHQIINLYHHEKAAFKRDKAVVHILTSNGKAYTYLYVNLKFPYQRLVYDRVKRQADLLMINSRGIFVLILLNCKSNRLDVNQDDVLDLNNLVTQSTNNRQLALNLRKLVNVDLGIVNYLIPSQFDLTPHVGVICTNPNVKINLQDPHFKIIYPRELKKLLDHMKPVLDKPEVNRLNQKFHEYLDGKSKYRWQVFIPTIRHVITDLLWYQNQIKELSHELKN